MGELKDSCATCRFYEPNAHDWKRGEAEVGMNACLRRAPIINPIAKEHWEIGPAWPKVRHTYWCGDYERDARRDESVDVSLGHMWSERPGGMQLACVRCGRLFSEELNENTPCLG